jgi:hypothetical protein
MEGAGLENLPTAVTNSGDLQLDAVEQAELSGTGRHPAGCLSRAVPLMGSLAAQSGESDAVDTTHEVGMEQIHHLCAF